MEVDHWNRSENGMRKKSPKCGDENEKQGKGKGAREVPHHHVGRHLDGVLRQVPHHRGQVRYPTDPASRAHRLRHFWCSASADRGSSSGRAASSSPLAAAISGTLSRGARCLMPATPMLNMFGAACVDGPEDPSPVRANLLGQSDRVCHFVVFVRNAVSQPLRPVSARHRPLVIATARVKPSKVKVTPNTHRPRALRVPMYPVRHYVGCSIVCQVSQSFGQRF
jgi:hypothetical protein